MNTNNFMASQLDSASRIEVEKVGDFTYVGVAKPTAIRSDSLWSIQRIEKTLTGNSIKWANGSPTFDKIMDNYASYTYS